jgi:prolyl 4-hydroxylase
MKRETSIGKVDGDVQDNAILQATRNFGKLQQATGTSRAQTLDVVQKSIEYMATPEVQSLSGPFKAACRNAHALCSFWATVGECENNQVRHFWQPTPAIFRSYLSRVVYKISNHTLVSSLQGYMKLNCAPACGSCELIDITKRCPPLPEGVEPALGPGALNAMFDRIVASAPGNITDLVQKRQLADFLNGMPEYTVHVLSRPSDGPVSGISLEKDKELPPWLITFDNFVSDNECNQLIALG